MQEDQFIFDFSCKLNLEVNKLKDQNQREGEDFCVKVNISLEQNVVPNLLIESTLENPQENIVYDHPAEICIFYKNGDSIHLSKKLINNKSSR
jgi:hypothetical protein